MIQNKLYKAGFKIAMIIAFVTILGIVAIPSTSTFFTASFPSTSSTAQTGDWTPPPVPTLISPCGIHRNTSGMVMDWSDVTDDLNNPVHYIYQSARDAAFTNIAYTSVSLASSQIPAPGTPEGAY